MGFSLDNVTSDDKHYGAFTCTICHNLVSLDCVITSSCSHPFCRDCLEEWVLSRASKNRSCSCPTCQQDLIPPTKVQVTGTMLFGNTIRVFVQPLSQAQPLAMKVLRLVQVSCNICKDKNGATTDGKNKMGWTGDYGNWDQHNQIHENQSLSTALLGLPGADRVRPISSDERSKQMTRSLSLPSVVALEKEEAAKQAQQAADTNNVSKGPPRATSYNANKKEIKLSNSKTTSTNPSDIRSRSKSPARIIFNMPRLSASFNDFGYHHNAPDNNNPTGLDLGYNTNENDDNEDEDNLRTKLKPLKAFNTKRRQSNENIENSVLGLEPENKHEDGEDLRSKLKPLKGFNTKRRQSNEGFDNILVLEPENEEKQSTSAAAKEFETMTSQPSITTPQSAGARKQGVYETITNAENDGKIKKPYSASAAYNEAMPISSKLGGVGTTPLSLRGGKNKINTKNIRPAPENSSDMADNLEVSYGQLDWNLSLSNLQMTYGAAPAKEPVQTFQTVPEDGEFELEFEDDASRANNNNDSGGEERSHNKHSGGDKEMSNTEAMELGEKYKKQANAKFNKGDFSGARSLYSDGLDVMSRISPITPEVRDTVATLYSNRAVTYFREKKFENCIRDCNKSLDYDKAYEKSYIRKWRALSALGQFEEAVECLELAKQEIPSSSKVAAELAKAQEQQQILDSVNQMIENGDLKKAKDAIKPLVKASCDNINLLLSAAVIDAGLGTTDSALEKVNKVLKFNPNNLEGLEMKAYVQFLSGDMEKGCRLLQELYSRNRDNKKVAARMNACQATLNFVIKGRNFHKRIRHREAAEQITAAIEYSPSNLPPKSTLSCILRTERAEEYLLCKQFNDALNDVESVLKEFNEDVSAWTLKADIYIAMGAPKIIKQELHDMRREQAWAAKNKVIDEIYRKVDFETKLAAAESDLISILTDIAQGVSERVVVESRCGSFSKAGGDGRGGASLGAKKLSNSAAEIAAGAQAVITQALERSPGPDGSRKVGGSDVAAMAAKKERAKSGTGDREGRPRRTASGISSKPDRDRRGGVDRHRSAEGWSRPGQPPTTKERAARARSRSSERKTTGRRANQQEKMMASSSALGMSLSNFEGRKYSRRSTGQ